MAESFDEGRYDAQTAPEAPPVDPPQAAGTPETPLEDIVDIPDVAIKLNPDFDNEDGDVTLSVPGHEDIVLPADGASVTVPADIADLAFSSPAVAKVD